MKSNAELLDQFESNFRTRGRSEGTIRVYTSHVRTFTNWLDGKSLLDVDEDSLELYINHLLSKNLKAKSMSSIFDALNALFGFFKFKKFINNNPIPEVRKFYLSQYKDEEHRRQVISVEDAGRLINSIIFSRDRAIATLLFKTGVRIQELCDIDLSDINWETQSIRLKPKPKRSNRTVFFDEECAKVLKHWIRQRETWGAETSALFIGGHNNRRVDDQNIRTMLEQHAARLGLHNPKSKELEDRLTPHSCRHWFTTYLSRRGMSREFIQELRGDAHREAFDDYNHIDPELLRKSYLECIPPLGII